MKRLLYFLIAIYSVSSGLGFSQHTKVGDARLELPQLKSNEYIINHKGFSLSYNESFEQANWVAYVLTSNKTRTISPRTNKFLVDPSVKSGSACDDDYVGSGYDKGHLAPAADMGWSVQSMHDCFYYSNMSPQVPGFNRGIWKRAEQLVRCWAIKYQTIYVVTGPVLSPNLPTIGIEKVSIPKYFYKIVLDYHNSIGKGIGFIIPNNSSSEPLQNFAVSIDSVEKVTKINFFPLLPIDQEKKIEGRINLNEWAWNNTTTHQKFKNKSNSVQCKGITKTGERCKKNTTDPSGFCYLHREI